MTRGFVIVSTDLNADFHQSVFQEARYVSLREGNPGNNILPRIAKLQEVLHDPNVAGALESILGPDYWLHPHRHDWSCCVVFDLLDCIQRCPEGFLAEGVQAK